MRVWSEVTNQYYDPEECYFFKNALQSGAYIHHGAKLQHLYFDTQDNKITFGFLKSDHKKLKLLWKKHELIKKNNTKDGDNIGEKKQKETF